MIRITQLTGILIVVMSLITSQSASAGILFSGSGDPSAVGFDGVGMNYDTPRAGAIAGGGMTAHQTGVGSHNANSTADPDVITSELDRAAGYFVEFRFEAVDNAPGNSNYGWGGFMGIRDTIGESYGFAPTPNDGNPPESIGMIDWGNFPPGGTVVAPINPGEFNTVRMTMPPGGTEIEFSVNGEFVASRNANGEGDGCCSVFFGNGGDGGSAEIYYDYVAVNQEIPEPTSAMLLSLGVAGILAWYRRGKRRRT